MDPNKKELIDLLKDNEMAMCELYQKFASEFPVYHSFWKGIAEEEESHAAWIITLGEKMDANLADLALSRFPVEAIRESIDYCERLKYKSGNKDYNLIDALNHAVHIERGMLENKFFEVFEGDSLELKAILDALRVATEMHLKEVEKVLEKENKFLE